MFEFNVLCISCKLFGVEWTTITCFYNLRNSEHTYSCITLPSTGIVAFAKTLLKISTTGYLEYSFIICTDSRREKRTTKVCIESFSRYVRKFARFSGSRCTAGRPIA